jgi:hypothetical protein
MGALEGESDHSLLSDAAIVGTLNAAHDLAVNAARNLRVPRDITEHYAILLYFTLIECCGSFAILFENRRVAGVAAIARSALDAFVDIKNLLSDQEYWRNLEAADSFEWNKLMQTASGPRNDFLSGLSADPNFPLYRTAIAQAANDGKMRGVVKLSPEARFEKADIPTVYKSLYPMLSADAHNNTSLLRSRHAQPVGDWYEIGLYMEIGGYGTSVAATLSEMLMFASEDMHEAFGWGKGMVHDIRAIVEPLQKAVIDHGGRPKQSNSDAM